MLPYYRDLTASARDLGIKLIMVDSDGDIRKLIPLFLEGGVNALLPFEVTGGQDVREVRKEYGCAFSMLGGLDKKAMARGGQTLEEEVRDKLRYMFKDGGYMPGPDHGIPPDVPLAHYARYVEIAKEEIRRRFGSDVY